MDTRLIETAVHFEYYAWECETCKGLWVFDGENPKEHNYNYCPKCGRKIVEYVEWTEEEED